MNKSREPQRFPVEPETVMAAYEILIKNCRNHHDTCQGCPIHITDPEPYPSGILRYTCAAFPSGNIPPAAWPELDPDNTDGGQIVALDVEAQRIAIAMARADYGDVREVRTHLRQIQRGEESVTVATSQEKRGKNGKKD